MYSSFTLAKKYLHYYLSAANGRGHGIHSPFIFDFITTVLNDKRQYPVYGQVEQLRKKLLNDQRILLVQDFGAGSSIDKSGRRRVSSIAKHAAKPKKYGQLLYRIVKKYQPQYILELGTSLGITSNYLASGSGEGTVTSFEGAKEIAAVAKQNFDQLGILNIRVVEGDFEQTFISELAAMERVDFCFIDGNHRREPTERYFNLLLEKINSHSILVFDDIHWSQEMEQAWDNIKKNDKVRYAIDLFFIGIVFFRDEFREKQDFVIRY